ncbi:MAG TPA: SpoIIE family protein phosphatase [Terriglobales bacterium]|nr:SpoIIE family protein phosphatase [Terriglobales bacterium]
MDLFIASLRSRLGRLGLWPASRLARAAWYSLALALVLFVLQELFGALGFSWGKSLGGWVEFLSILSILLFGGLGFRWLRARVLWRLRNRLIVTYVFIGVVPALLLLAMALATLYLLAGQFANFIVTSEINLQLHSLEATNAAVSNEMAARLERGEPAIAQSLEGLRRTQAGWKRRELCAWLGTQPLVVSRNGDREPAFSFPSFLHGPFREIVHDHDKLYLRAGTVLPVHNVKLSVVSSEELDKDQVEEIAANLGEITLYSATPEAATAPAPAPLGSTADSSTRPAGITIREAGKERVLAGGQRNLRALFTAGSLPPAAGSFDHPITFGTPLPGVSWETGDHEPTSALVRVQTRPSLLYERLFAALGDFAKGVEYILLAIAVVLAVIELLALLIGASLTRTITGAVAQLYEATQHIDRGDFSHRIPVKTSDQLAQLAISFNSMTASIEKLILEQKEKQRLENELTIAQEVQAQLFPRQITQLTTLELHGFCRPARTVSGDYYDFLAINADKLILAVGDVSGKGISAALLMATLHSAVRAYSLEGVPQLREPMAVGGRARAGTRRPTAIEGVETSPAMLLCLLNHQLFQSTPQEKYATLFLAVYDEPSRSLTYSNGGHLPPLIIGPSGGIRRLDQGGTVVGLFDRLSFDEGSSPLKPGDIFVAYSDGVTEPENDFGEFGEERLIDLVRGNRTLPLSRISEIVTSAVDDWIGDKEQPDDITLVLARAR